MTEKQLPNFDIRRFSCRPFSCRRYGDLGDNLSKRQAAVPATAKPADASAARGLATLEMVLVLPILLLIMALMVNIGVVACWKVRSLSVAREAVWGTRWPRSGICYHRPAGRDPRPKYWQPPASAEVIAAGRVAELDDQRVDHQVVRGPLANGNQVDADLLDPARGFRRGSAEITRDFPMLAKLGPYDLQADTRLLDDKWRYPEMKMSSNVQIRTTIIYTLAQAPTTLVNAYLQAVAAVRNAPFRPDLNPLHGIDDDFFKFQQIFGWSGRPPNFHPTLNPGHRRAAAFCSLDQDVAERRVANLVDRIQGDHGVYQRMSNWFRNMYNRAKREYESQLDAVPPPPPNERNALQGEIDRLEEIIQKL